MASERAIRAAAAHDYALKAPKKRPSHLCYPASISTAAFADICCVCCRSENFLVFVASFKIFAFSYLQEPRIGFATRPNQLYAVGLERSSPKVESQFKKKDNRKLISIVHQTARKAINEKFPIFEKNVPIKTKWN